MYVSKSDSNFSRMSNLHSSSSLSSLTLTPSAYASSSSSLLSLSSVDQIDTEIIALATTPNVYNGRYGFYYKINRDPTKEKNKKDHSRHLFAKSHDEEQYYKLLEKISSSDKPMILQSYGENNGLNLHKKHKSLEKLLPLTNSVSHTLLKTIYDFELIKEYNVNLVSGLSSDIHMGVNNKLILNEEDNQYDSKMLINFRYNFTITPLSMDHIVSCINTMRIIFNTMANSERQKEYKEISDGMINLFVIGKEFEMKYKHLMEYNEITPVIFNRFDCDNKEFLDDMMKLYGLVVHQFILTARLNSKLSDKQLIKFNKLVESGCKLHRFMNISLNIWCDRTVSFAKK